MASPNQILGKCTITINGQVYNSEPGAELTPGYGSREEVQGENGVDGFTEKAGVWMLKAKFWAKAGMRAVQFWNMVDVTIIFTGDNGYTATIVQATTKTISSIKSGEKAGWDVEFFGMTGNEATS